MIIFDEYQRGLIVGHTVKFIFVALAILPWPAQALVIDTTVGQQAFSQETTSQLICFHTLSPLLQTEYK